MSPVVEDANASLLSDMQKPLYLMSSHFRGMRSLIFLSAKVYRKMPSGEQKTMPSWISL